MSSISIKRRHALSHEQAKAAAERIAMDLNKRYALAYKWDGDQVVFDRPGLSGNMRVGRNDVHLDVQLSFLLTPLKRPIEQEILREFDALFGSPPPGSG
jgi:putative polyhydroxyalkanoate system protein